MDPVATDAGDEGDLDMTAFPTDHTTMPRTPIRAVLIAGADEVGREGAIELLDRLPLLRCPIIICIRNADLTSIRSRIDGARTRWAVDGEPLDAAHVWIAPPGRHTHVRDGRFRLSEGDGSLADAPSLGKLYHSLRVELGSRVFAVVIDTERTNTPQLRLLAQRGARVVSPIDCGNDAVATFWTPDTIVDHLRESLAESPEAAIA
jgi:CheB methylesterase